MSAKTRDWAIAIGYVVLIYSTLEIARLPLAALRSHGLLRIFLATLFFIAAFAVASVLAKQRPIKFWRFPTLTGIGLVYWAVSRQVQTPEEVIHFFEYGLVGIFFLRALTHHFGFLWKSWVFAVVLSSGAGWLDEILQGISPHRQYDIKDVALNAISAALGLAVYFICKNSDSHC